MKPYRGREEIGSMTIEDLEKAASRVSAALSVLREAGAWRPAEQVPYMSDSKPAPLSPPVRDVGMQPSPTTLLTPAELAERKRLLRVNLPDDIAAMEGA